MEELIDKLISEHPELSKLHCNVIISESISIICDLGSFAFDKSYDDENMIKVILDSAFNGMKNLHNEHE